MIKLKLPLRIITAVSRPYNLTKMQDNINSSFRSFIPAWHLYYDNRFALNNQVKSPQKITDASMDCSGAPQKNLGLSEFKDGLCCFLDDDNLIHSDFEKWLLYAICRSPSSNFYVFSQYRPITGRILVAHADNVKKDCIDIGQIVFRREAISTERFREKCYTSDWFWINELWEKDPVSFYFCDKVAVHYNVLRIP